METEDKLLLLLVGGAITAAVVISIWPWWLPKPGEPPAWWCFWCPR